VTNRDAWPLLDLRDWSATYDTLHMWTQIVGKTRLALAPAENHWWHVCLYVTPRGLTTSAIPNGETTFAVDFDFIDHRLYVRTSTGMTRDLALRPRPVADFFADYRETLAALGITPRIRAVPVEVEVAIPFAEDTQHHSYDSDAVTRWWRVLLACDRVLEQFRSGFIGKASPVHFFWGSFDLATTRFSGRRAPLHPGGVPNCPDFVMHEAYSHECTSVGFWPGGGSGVLRLRLPGAERVQRSPSETGGRVLQPRAARVRSPIRGRTTRQVARGGTPRVL
jgi:hypothetical protein